MLLKKPYEYDLIVIGSGAGGGVAAQSAASLGKKVALFEKGDIGGECPNFACVPTKALLQSAEVFETVQNSHVFGINVKNISVDFEHIHKRKNLVVSRTGATHGESVFENSGVHLIKHKAIFIAPHIVEANGREYTAKHFLLASGSTMFIPNISGLTEAGYLTFKQAVNLKKLPESLFIIGGGAVACEFAQIFSSFGVKVKMAVRSTLLSSEDREVIDLVQALFENRGIEILNEVSVSKVEHHKGKKIVHYTYGGREDTDTVDEILIATGKVPVLDYGLEKAGVKTSHHGILVNRFLQTSNPHIYAAGDVVGPYLFTHSGYYQSSLAVQNMFGRKKVSVSYRTVPRCVFLTPEVASVGMTEEQAKNTGIRVKKGLAAMSILGRSNTSEEFDGFVKVVTDSSGTILGASIVAMRAGEMIHELALAVELRVKAQTIANMMHAYPTYSEAIKIACSNLEYC